jgi:uncharacterized protein (TIRG00374 family)
MNRRVTSILLQLGPGLIISIGLLVWIYFIADWQAVYVDLRDANYWLLFLALALAVFQYYLRAVRWRYFLPDSEASTLRHRFDSIMIGNLATFILPLRAGELIRPAMLSMLSPIDFSACFVSIIIERFFDLSAVLISSCLVFVYIPGIPRWAIDGASVLLVLAVCLLFITVYARFHPKKLAQIAGVLTRALPIRLQEPLDNFLEKFINGTQLLCKKSSLIRIAILTILIWVTIFYSFYVFFLIFHINTSFWSAITLTVIVSLAVAAPSVPGFIGVYQAACIAGFSICHLSTDSATAYATVSHLFQYVLFAGYGGVSLLSYDLSFRHIRERVKY